jgi:hypothetical protein
VRGQSAPEPPARIKAAQWERTKIAAVLAVLLRGIVAAWLKAMRRSPRVKTNMWRVVAILALSLSGCVSTKPLDQAFGAGQGRQIIKSEIAFFLSGQVGAEPASQR